MKVARKATQLFTFDIYIRLLFEVFLYITLSCFSEVIRADIDKANRALSFVIAFAIL